MQKSNYINQTTNFVQYLSEVIAGEVSVDHRFHVRDPRFKGNRSVSIANLADGFKAYEWAGSKYDESNGKLDAIKASYDATINATTDAHIRDAACRDMIQRVMEWGLGKGPAYKANMEWAHGHQLGLYQRIESGREIIDSDIPDTTDFDAKLRMNAGYTKVFALLCRRSIIYDGRVGAALGFLVRRYCVQSRRSEVPALLTFPWASPRSDTNGFSRDPSGDGLTFPKLNNRSRYHADWNIRANWLIEAAMLKASANSAREGRSDAWWDGEDGMRKVEAALFMLGYRFDDGEM